MPVSINGNGSVVGVTSVTGAGMDLIVPTSVAGTGVTLSGGQVNFSAAASVSVNGCFTSTYANYFLVFNASATGGGNVTFRYRSAGTDNSTTNYTRRALYINVSTTPQGLYSASSSSALDITTPTTGGSYIGHIVAPQLAQQTMSTINWISQNFGGTSTDIFTATTQFDGISFIESSLTGTLRIYGLRNS
jgi:hypothetical protein